MLLVCLEFCLDIVVLLCTAVANCFMNVFVVLGFYLFVLAGCQGTAVLL